MACGRVHSLPSGVPAGRICHARLPEIRLIRPICGLLPVLAMTFGGRQPSPMHFGAGTARPLPSGGDEPSPPRFRGAKREVSLQEILSFPPTNIFQKTAPPFPAKLSGRRWNDITTFATWSRLRAQPEPIAVRRTQWLARGQPCPRVLPPTWRRIQNTLRLSAAFGEGSWWNSPSNRRLSLPSVCGSRGWA